MKNETCVIKLTDEDSIFELCEMPHRCSDCTNILHKIKRVLTEDWFIESLNYSHSLCIELESEIVPAMAPLFRIQGILDFKLIYIALYEFFYKRKLKTMIYLI